MYSDESVTSKVDSYVYIKNWTVSVDIHRV
jgi:hypothetical protein